MTEALANEVSSSLVPSKPTFRLVSRNRRRHGCHVTKLPSRTASPGSGPEVAVD